MTAKPVGGLGICAEVDPNCIAPLDHEPDGRAVPSLSKFSAVMFIPLKFAPKVLAAEPVPIVMSELSKGLLILEPESQEHADCQVENEFVNVE